MEKNCEGEGALIANRRDGGEFRASQCLLKRETEHLWLRQLMHGIERERERERELFIED